MNCIEDILEIEIINNLKYKYSSINDQQTLLIFFLRSFIYYESINPSNEQYIDFLLMELNLPRNLYFNNIKINLGQYGDNNLQNILDNFIYKYLECPYNDTVRGNIIGKELLLSYYNQYITNAQKMFKYKKKKSIHNYKFVFKYCLLQYLYKDFNCNIQPNKLHDNFAYPTNFTIQTTIDQIYEQCYLSYVKKEENMLEKDLENYICKHGIDDIKIINRQLKVKSGIIDLLGVDNNNNKVLLELKIVNRPVDLLWQVQTYTEDIKTIYKTNIRTVVVAPKLNNTIFNQLPNFVEVYEFTKNKTYKFKKVK